MTNSPPSLRDVEEPRLHALVELMFLAAAADGDFSGDERKEFQNSVESLTDRKINGETLDVLLNRIEKDHAGEGRQARIAHVRDALPSPELRKIGLEMAIRVMCADGIVRTSERELILDLADGLAIDPNIAADLVAQLSSEK
ncbi:MAG: TerB family tellurite resistance protein [Polyangiaceae bacterium]|nr:TerB family tellurite resistance protein [Polyangiaceae bacterium]